MTAFAGCCCGEWRCCCCTRRSNRPPSPLLLLCCISSLRCCLLPCTAHLTRRMSIHTRRTAAASLACSAAVLRLRWRIPPSTPLPTMALTIDTAMRRVPLSGGAQLAACALCTGSGAQERQRCERAEQRRKEGETLRDDHRRCERHCTAIGCWGVPRAAAPIAQPTIDASHRSSHSHSAAFY